MIIKPPTQTQSISSHRYVAAIRQDTSTVLWEHTRSPIVQQTTGADTGLVAWQGAVQVSVWLSTAGLAGTAAGLVDLLTRAVKRWESKRVVKINSSCLSLAISYRRRFGLYLMTGVGL